ncbi:hypothetical protein GGR55DRAFT_677124 [Xylaria sp. FL0064]|nr:hypothetical protein GGR55DRAFT_677124 [Xylaria sp. FL0064]
MGRVLGGSNLDDPTTPRAVYTAAIVYIYTPQPISGPTPRVYAVSSRRHACLLRSSVLGRLFAVALNHQTGFGRLIDLPNAADLFEGKLVKVAIKLDRVNYAWYTDVPYSARHDWPNLFTETVATVLFPTITGWLQACNVSDMAAGTF